MTDLLIENVDDETYALLQKRADAHGRSLEEETRYLIEAAVARDRREQFFRWADEFRRSLEGREHSDSADLIREDRDSDHGREW